MYHASLDKSFGCWSIVFLYMTICKKEQHLIKTNFIKMFFFFFNYNRKIIKTVLQLIFRLKHLCICVDASVAYTQMHVFYILI